MPLLSVQGLSVEYRLRRVIFALSGVNLDCEKGECTCVVGESGSGKSTLARTIGSVLPPSGLVTGGKILFDGEDLLLMNEKRLRASVRWKRISLVFQNSASSLNSFLSVRTQITEVLIRHLGATKQEAEARARELLVSVGVPASRLSAYPHELSGGMKQRIAIAMAISCNPDLVIADEPTTGLDVTSAGQIGRLFRKLVNEGVTMLVNTHDLGFAATIADNFAIMYGGMLMEMAPASQFLWGPGHPYSLALMNSIPRPDEPDFKPTSIPGEPPTPFMEITGCPFEPRCRFAEGLCREKRPAMVSLGPGFAACHFAGRLKVEN